MKKILITLGLLISININAAQSENIEKVKGDKPINISVLSKIETYVAPTNNSFKETYDYRKEGGEYIMPPTLKDTFVSDIYLILTLILKKNEDDILSKDIMESFEFYMKKKSNQIPGLKPWTHDHFIESLTQPERKILANEVFEYKNKYGLRKGGKKGEEKKAPLNEVEHNYIKSFDVFSVDGLKAGMTRDEVLPLKWPKNKEGSYNVMAGQTNMMTEILYGKELSGEFLSYDTYILSQKATVSLWFTKKSHQLYGVRVDWSGLTELDLKQKVKKIFNEKYGVSHKGKKGKNMLDGGDVWQPNAHTKIILNLSIGADMSFKLYADYIDTKLQNEDKISSKKVSQEDMDRL